MGGNNIIRCIMALTRQRLERRKEVSVNNNPMRI